MKKGEKKTEKVEPHTGQLNLYKLLMVYIKRYFPPGNYSIQHLMRSCESPIRGQENIDVAGVHFSPAIGQTLNQFGKCTRTYDPHLMGLPHQM